MTNKVIAVDLDGTLLNSESKISDFTKETIKKISAKGHKVIITTAVLTAWLWISIRS